MSELSRLKQENRELRRELHESRQRIALLEQKIDALVRRIFGSKSERLNKDQLELLLSGIEEPPVAQSEEDDPDPKPGRPGRPRHGRSRVRTPEDLEVVQEVIKPDLVEVSPEDWKCIGEETSRRLDYEPGRFFWRETIRPKYVLKQDRGLPPAMAPARPHVIDHGLASEGLLAHLLVSRFIDHLPYYRQERIFEQRHGVFIARQQMVQWVEQSVRSLSGITDCLRNQLRRSPYAQVDETPVRYQDPEREGSCGQGYLWVGLIPGKLVYFDWHASRGTQCLHSLLGEDFGGKLQCDGYTAYQSFASEQPSLKLFGCWAHLRRRFREAVDQAPRRVGWILNQIGWLYHWERLLRDSRAGPRERMAFRSQASRMVVERLYRVMVQFQGAYLPQSSMGKAIRYALNQWPSLVGFLDHGEIEIDTNLVENAIRPTAVGKKNWLFMGSEEAGQRNAVIYTLVENCRMHGIEPYAYLKDVLKRLPYATNQTIEELTPLNWKQSRQAAVKIAA